MLSAVRGLNNNFFSAAPFGQDSHHPGRKFAPAENNWKFTGVEAVSSNSAGRGRQTRESTTLALD